VYAEFPVQLYWNMSWVQRKAKGFNWPYLRTWAEGLFPHFGRNVETVGALPKIEKADVADIDELLEKARVEEISKAKIKGPLPVAKPGEIQKRCANLLGEAAHAA
jgi:hypothetical protein